MLKYVLINQTLQYKAIERSVESEILRTISADAMPTFPTGNYNRYTSEFQAPNLFVIFHVTFLGKLVDKYLKCSA